MNVELRRHDLLSQSYRLLRSGGLQTPRCPTRQASQYISDHFRSQRSGRVAR